MNKDKIINQIEVEFNVKFDFHYTGLRGNMEKAIIPINDDFHLSVLHGYSARCNKNTVEVCVVATKEFYVGQPENQVSFKRLKEIVKELKKAND